MLAFRLWGFVKCHPGREVSHRHRIVLRVSPHYFPAKPASELRIMQSSAEVCRPFGAHLGVVDFLPEQVGAGGSRPGLAGWRGGGSRSEPLACSGFRTVLLGGCACVRASPLLGQPLVVTRGVRARSFVAIASPGVLGPLPPDPYCLPPGLQWA